MEKNHVENDITLFIPKSIIYNNTYSNYALAVHCVLQTLSIPTQIPIQCVTIHQLIYYLTGLESQQRNHIYDYIKCGLNELIINNVVIKLSEFQKHVVLDCSNLWTDTENEKFAIVTFQEVKKIFQAENTNNFLLLKYFVLLMESINTKTTVYLDNGMSKNRVVGNMTINYLSEISGLAERTVIEYNKLLEELGLLYIHRQEDFIITDNNEIKKLANVYGRPNDSLYIDTFAENQRKYLQSYGYVNKSCTNANIKRRLAQMYQQILRGNGEKYSKSEIISVFNYVISENRKYENLYKKDNQQCHLKKIRDITVFEKYDFIDKSDFY